MKQKNPFVLVGYSGPEYFCDRERETRKLVSWLENGSNVTLMAPRRYGKTGLIHNVFHNLPTGFRGVYLDIYSTKSLVEFTRTFASAVVGAVDSPLEKTLSAVARFFKSCRPTVTPQEDGLPKFSFDVAPSTAEATLGEAFAYLKGCGGSLVVAIDEFQQILDYPEKGTEALLRAYVQGVPQVRFVFAGSRQHLMGEMFATAKHPFYNSTDIMSLPTIDVASYAAFAERFFVSDGKPFDREAFRALYDRFDGVTWYVQRVLNGLWVAGEGLSRTEQVEAVVSDLVADRALVFRDLYESQGEVAQRLLPKIAAARVVSEPTAQAFLAACGLSASSVRSALADLCTRELVYRSEAGYLVYERLFGEWLRALPCASSSPASL